MIVYYTILYCIKSYDIILYILIEYLLYKLYIIYCSYFDLYMLYFIPPYVARGAVAAHCHEAAVAVAVAAVAVAEAPSSREMLCRRASH